MYRVLLDGICVGVCLTETTSHYSGLGNVFLVQNSCVIVYSSACFQTRY